MNVRSSILSLVAGALAAAAAPGAATTTTTTAGPIDNGDVVVFDFDLTSSSSVGSTYGNSRAFEAVVKDKATGAAYDISLSATAWTATKVSGSSYYTIDNAYLGQYSEGLGVITRTDAGGNGNNHQIDNVGSVDFIMLSFDRAVTLTAIERYSYTLYAINSSNQATSTCVNTGCKLDNDAAYKATATTAAALANAVAQAKLYPSTAPRPVTDPSTWTTVPTGKTINGTTLLAATAHVSDTWLVGGAFGNPDSVNLKDGFKLSGVEVAWVATVPEPSTWATMILGFGFVGTAMRRRRQATAAIA